MGNTASQEAADTQQLAEDKKKKEKADTQAITESKKHPNNYKTSSKDDGTSSNIPVTIIRREQKEETSGLVEKSETKSFQVLPQDLSITWGEDPRYWSWFYLKETRDTHDSFFLVANLLNVCWLEVIGKFETAKLSPGETYEVAFIVMLKEQAYGWEAPVNLRLVAPNGAVVERSEILKNKPREEWIELPIGTFSAPEKEQGVIEFSLFERKNGEWKRGLLIRGAIIRPYQHKATV